MSIDNVPVKYVLPSVEIIRGTIAFSIAAAIVGSVTIVTLYGTESFWLNFLVIVPLVYTCIMTVICTMSQFTILFVCGFLYGFRCSLKKQEQMEEYQSILRETYTNNTLRIFESNKSPNNS